MSVERKSGRTLTVLAAILLVVGGGGVLDVVVHAAPKAEVRQHPHRGKLAPFAPGSFSSLRLSGADEKSLADGRAVMKQIRVPGATSGRGVCVQDVEAPTPAVWNQILDFNNYKGKVPKVLECQNYVVRKHADGSVTLKTKMVVSVLPGYKFQWYCDHRYRPNRRSLTWSLDYDRFSDIDDVAGHWHVTDHPQKKGWTRVFYACDLRLKTAAPGPVMNFLTQTALRQATSWVKKESEAKPNAVVSKKYLKPISSSSSLGGGFGGWGAGLRSRLPSHSNGGGGGGGVFSPLRRWAGSPTSTAGKS